MRTADGDGDMGRSGGVFGIPFVQNAQPPDKIAPSIAARRAAMRADRQVNLAPRFQQFSRDLRARRPRAHHQHRALRQLCRVAIGAGVHLGDCAVLWHGIWHNRPLKRACGGDDILGLESPSRSLHCKPRPPFQTAGLGHRNTAADGGCDLFGVDFKVFGYGFLANKGIGMRVGKFHPRKAIMPCGAIGHQRIPAFRPPAFRDPSALQHKMRYATAGQMLAHRHASLTAAHDQGLHLFDRSGMGILCHGCSFQSICGGTLTAPILNAKRKISGLGLGTS